MNLDSGEPLQVEESVQDEGATGCFGDRLSSDSNKMEVVSIDKTVAENQMHNTEDNRYSEQTQGDDHHEFTVRRFKDSYSCKADGQDGSNVKSVEGSNDSQCFDDICQSKPDFLEPEDNVKLQAEDPVISVDLKSSQIHAAGDLDHTKMEVPSLMAREFEVKNESSDECLTTGDTSFNIDLINAHSKVDTHINADRTIDILQETIIDNNHFNPSINKHVSEISQTEYHPKDDVQSKLALIHNNLHTSELTDTMTREIDEIPKHDLKVINSNDQHVVRTIITEKLNPAKQDNKSLETDILIDLTDDRFLEEISKSLIDRDMTMYDRTFLGADPEESAQNQHKNANSISKMSENNQQTAFDNKLSVEPENVSDIPSTVESISATTDLNKSSATGQLNITENVKLLEVEQPDLSKNSDKVALLTNLIEAITTEESSSSVKNTDLQPLIKDESNLSEIQTLSKPKNLEEPTYVIQKLQNMNWLKPQSASESATARNRKMMLRSLPKKDERVENYFEGTKKNTNNSESRTNANGSGHSENQTSSALQSQHSEIAIQATALAQSNVWNKNTVDQLFPEAQLANVEDEQLSQAIVESICTAQQESEKRKMVGNLKIQNLDEPDDNEWSKKNYQNLPNEPPADLANNIKGLVDQYGRVGGYTEKHLFMGPGARRREQEFLKAQSENADSQASNKETLPSRTQQGPTNARSQEAQSQSSSQAPKKDAPLPSKTQQAPANARSDKDTPNEKPGFKQDSSRGCRRESTGKVETKLDSRFADKNLQSTQIEREETKDKPGFGQDASRNTQQQQRGQTMNQESKAGVRGQSAKQDVKIEGRGQNVKQEVKTETRGQNQQRTGSARFEDMSNRDKPGFNQGPIKDSNAALSKQDLDNNKSQQPSNSNRYYQSDNKSQDDYNRHGNFDRRDGINKNMVPVNKNQDNDQYKSQHQDYYNRNQSQDNHSRIQTQDRSLRNSGQDYPARNRTQDNSDDKIKTQDRSGKNQIQDHLDRYQSQDNFNKNRGQDRIDRNQNQDNLNNRAQYQESNKNPSSFGRFQDNSNKNQNSRDRNQTNRVDSFDYQNRNQFHDRYNESGHRDQDRYNRNQDNANKNQDRFQKAHSEENWDHYETAKPKLSLQSDRFHEARNKDLGYQKHQDTGNKYQDNVNKNQERFQKAHSEENWDDNESINPKSNFQRVSDNKSHQQPTVVYHPKGYYNQESSNSKSGDQYRIANLQENRKVVVEKKMDLPIKINANSDIQNINTILSRSNITSSTQSNSSIGSLVEAKHPLRHFTPNTTMSALITKEIKNDHKEETPKAETVVTFSHVHESSTPEARPNVVLAFEGNQNVQRALGLDINAAQAVQSINPQMINAAYANSPMNVNALSFEASNLNAQQGLNCPQVDSPMSSLPLAYSAGPNINSVEAQLRMNEISNLSQDILRLHTTVVSLAKQLASAQADLLVAQAKFNQYQQYSAQADNASNDSPMMQAESPSVPANFYTMQCIAPPGFTTATPNIQKIVQPDAYQLPKSYATSNVQQDFAINELHSNTALDQRLIQQYHLYQQQQSAANFQQYNANINANVTATSAVSRERIVPQSQPQPQLNKGRELRGCRSQFYN
ncbi:uncharacterized protein LOC116416014 [Nasonia vitripennis]|uniref:Uncharacterized protein n=1 Tax=Nasonia vitripennis TaxID=7425 RepID=A0A7M7PZR3_NASVI|nr:uncharacterized protein LOC116416014 [Nasonia vitripennis]XP_031778037.1 uncharacterized protein LOC116416014 [Nasonia vitripennis]XP_031778038.1 uncharacterized protein LOC116416014 [Nasonia vitripennis]